MRVSFSCQLKSDSGKQKFAIRLANELRKRHIKITNKKPDINLVFIKGIKSGCKNVIRLDNAWMNSKINSQGRNRKIRKTMQKCDGVVYQGKYSKKVCQKFIGKHAQSVIIPKLGFWKVH